MQTTLVIRLTCLYNGTNMFAVQFSSSDFMRRELVQEAEVILIQ